MDGGIFMECECSFGHVDNLLKVGSTFDWITPASGLLGINPDVVLWSIFGLLVLVVVVTAT